MGQIIAGGEQFETHIEADYRGRILRNGPDSGEVDAFGRHRVSEPFTLFDSTLRFTKRTDQWFEILSGSGSTNYLVNESSLELKTTTASGDSALRRTKRRMPYQPGKSLLVLQSFVPHSPIAGLRQEVGLFDDNNGVMFRINGTTAQFVIRSNATGSVVENVIDQSAWNIDSFASLDLSKVQIFIADLEWLGSGRVRVGFVMDGETRYCHEFNHANNADSVYMTTATLPLSYRIENTAETAEASTLKQICCTAMSEGGYEPSGPIYPGGRGINSVASISAETLVAAIRMKAGRLENVIMPAQIDATADGNSIAQWRLYKNPTLSGDWYDAENGRGNVQVMSSGTISGGTVVEAGFTSGRDAAAFTPESALALALGVDENGNSDILALTIQCETTMKATGMIGWRELV